MSKIKQVFLLHPLRCSKGKGHLTIDTQRGATKGWELSFQNGGVLCVENANSRFLISNTNISYVSLHPEEAPNPKTKKGPNA